MPRTTHRLRMLLLAFLSLVAFCAIEVRLFYLQVPRHEDYRRLALNQQSRQVLLTPRRGAIYDRNLNPLATSYLLDTIYLDTRALKDHLDALELKIRDKKLDPSRRLDVDRLVRLLSEGLEVPTVEVEQILDRPPRRHLLMRKAPRETSEAVRYIAQREKLPADVLIFEKSSKRFYPNDSLAAHVLGFTKIDDHGDNIGLAGLELNYDASLKGAYRKEIVSVDSSRRSLEPPSETILNETYGDELVLTLDRQIQMFAEQALQRQIETMRAIGGVAVVLDVATGEILALANFPDFNLNAFNSATPDQRTNQVLTNPIEIGSVMKIFTTTLLIDNGLLSPDELIDCQNGSAQVAGRTLRDEHPLGVVPFRHAFAESSNIAMASLALRLDPEIHYQGLSRLGFGQPTGIDLPGEGSGILRPTHKWSLLSQGSLAIGYETAQTPLQVVAALAAIGNDGWRMQPHLVREIRTAQGRVMRRFEPRRIERVASAETCRIVRGLMKDVVTEGTGAKAKLAGYDLGGKTGTSRKQSKTVGDRAYFASFAGLVPIDQPRLAIFVSIDEPRGSIFASQVAAPVFREIAENAVQLLGIPPSDPVAFQMARAPETAETQPESGGPAQPQVPAAPAAPPVPADDAAIAAGPALPMTLIETDENVRHIDMPDCRGMTMIEVWQKLEEVGLKGQILGSGVLVRQQPAPGQSIPINRKPIMIFSQPSETAG